MKKPWFVVLVCLLSALFAAPTVQGRCDIGELYENINWSEVTHDWYTICYTAEYAGDVAFVERWVEHAWQLMRDKYGVTQFVYARYNRPLHLFVVLLPAPNADANTGTTRFQCCYDESGAYTWEGKFARIPYLAPSHPEWQRRPTWGVLQFPSEGYHIKNIIHEITHAGQHAIYGGYYPRPVPWWVYEGLAEYEGTFNTTESNRLHGFQGLRQYVRDEIPDRVFCCQTLEEGIDTLSTNDAYFGGNLMLLYLKEVLGEDIHARLIRHTHPTLIEALEAEFRVAGTSAEKVFEGLRAWLKDPDDGREITEESDLQFAHSARGAGWTTRLVLLNPQQDTAEAKVQVFGQDGIPWPSELLNVQGQGMAEWELPTGTGIETGGVVVSSLAKLSGFLRFRHGGVSLSVQSAPVASAFMVPVSEQVDRVGVAVFNASDEEVTAVFTMGARVSYETIPAKGKMAKFVDELFEDAGTGTLQVRTESSVGKISVLALEQIGSLLVTLPATPLD